MEGLSKDIISSFNKGQSAAFTKIYHHFYTSIFHFIKKIVFDTKQTEDITVETFVKLWNSRGHFVNENTIAAFLRTTARHASIDWLRKKQKENALIEDLSHIYANAETENFEEDIKSEVISLIQREIDQLPTQIKKVFVLAYFDGKKNEEIANILNIRNQSVRNHKARALKQLKIAMAGRAFLILFSLWAKSEKL